MALEMCPECFKQISSTAKFCPHCGYTKLTVIPKKRNTNILKTGFLVLAIFLFLIIIITWKGCNAWLSNTYNSSEYSLKENQELESRFDGSYVFEEWYKGGTLQDASVRFWKNATDENKLATCADFILKIDSTISKDELKKKARKLKRQINKAVYQPEITDETKVKEVAEKYIGVPLIYNDKYPIENNTIKILDIETSGILEKTIYIQIPEQFTKQQLEEIATQLRIDNSDYTRLFIFYYLPNMKIDLGAWATTHYNKDLEVRIMGVDKSSEAKIRNAGPSSGELIGKWYDKTPGIEHSIIISKIGSKYILKRAFRDGSEMEKDLKFSLSNGKMKFVYESDVGEYLLIEKNGQLGQYDNYGLIDKCDKIK